MMKTSQFIILTTLFLVLISCGTMGHIAFYEFNLPKYTVEKDLNNIIDKDSIFSLPAKMRPEGVDEYFETIYVNFKTNPIEIYQLGFNGDSAIWKNSTKSTLALIGVYNGDSWRFDRDLGYDEERRIEARLEDSILSKLPYPYKKRN
jgi:hypothetical protein